MSNKKPKPGHVFVEVSKNQSGGLSLLIGDESTGHRLSGGKVGGCESIEVFEVDAEELVREAKHYSVNQDSELVTAEETIQYLRDQVQGLAAENAKLKKINPNLQTMMLALDAFFADEYVPERAMLEAYNILRNAVETPATDAALAEIRAQGVEMFAKKCTEKSKQAISSDIRDNWWLAGEHASDFAAELRREQGK